MTKKSPQIYGPRDGKDHIETTGFGFSTDSGSYLPRLLIFFACLLTCPFIWAFPILSPVVRDFVRLLWLF